jgi:hypothetical protein
VGPRAGLDAVKKRKIPFPWRELNSGRPARSPSLYRLSCPGSSISDSNIVESADGQTLDTILSQSHLRSSQLIIFPQDPFEYCSPTSSSELQMAAIQKVLPSKFHTKFLFLLCELHAQLITSSSVPLPWLDYDGILFRPIRESLHCLTAYGLSKKQSWLCNSFANLDLNLKMTSLRVTYEQLKSSCWC